MFGDSALLVVDKAFMAQDPVSVSATRQPQLLHLGCGLCAPAEWTNVDGSSNAWLAQHPWLKRLVALIHVMPRSQLEIPWPTNIKIAKLTKPLPFPDRYFDATFSSHTVEHLYRA